MVPSVASPGDTALDDLDALFSIDPSMDEIFNNVNGDSNADGNNTREPLREHSARQGRAEVLGLDEEVKIAKKRQPVAKLDATRLLSDPGIPKLQRISKNRLKFRGKGYEFSDVAQLLRTYQLWLDDLYPRAKFADGLAMIEKLGHSKRMQVMRKAWIDEGKPRSSVEQYEAELEPLPATSPPGSKPEPQIMHTNGLSPDTGNPENELFPVPRIDRVRQPVESTLDEIWVGPDEDELDALLAEPPLQNSPERSNSFDKPQSPGVRRAPTPLEDLYEDDEEAMREMDEMW